MSTADYICPVCGQGREPGKRCEACAKVAAAAAQPAPPAENVEVAKPYVAAPEPYVEPITDEEVVPDVIGEVYGYRVWQVHHPHGENPEAVRLQSLGAGGPKHATIWTPGKTMEAYCAKGHVPPAEKCSCGFYAARTIEHLLSMHYHSGFVYDDTADALVVGKVAMSGKIIPGTQGWRAQRVRPVVGLVLPSRWKALAMLKVQYPEVQWKLENWLTPAELRDKLEGGV
jgi:hypothetical protein